MNMNLFPMCKGCTKRYPACQDTCPDAEEGRKKKLEIYAARRKSFELKEFAMEARERLLKRMRKSGKEV